MKQTYEPVEISDQEYKRLRVVKLLELHGMLTPVIRQAIQNHPNRENFLDALVKLGNHRLISMENFTELLNSPTPLEKADNIIDSHDRECHSCRFK